MSQPTAGSSAMASTAAMTSQRMIWLTSRTNHTPAAKAAATASTTAVRLARSPSGSEEKEAARSVAGSGPMGGAAVGGGASAPPPTAARSAPVLSDPPLRDIESPCRRALCWMGRAYHGRVGL